MEEYIKLKKGISKTNSSTNRRKVAGTYPADSILKAFKNLVPPVGLEPTTKRLRVSSATTLAFVYIGIIGSHVSSHGA